MAIKITLDNLVVEKVHGIKPAKRGFIQAVITRLPGEEFRGVMYPDEYFVISAYSTSQTDSRFLQPTDEKRGVKAVVYLKGEKWKGQRGDDQFAHKLNLVEWTK